MSNGNGVKSVSLADGTLSPDLRVNYNFGLVLGVNEFKQEQEYFLQKDYLYNRAFEGYGTVSGLRVTAEWLKGEDVQITVGSGMAIDQFGRPIIIRQAQCARLVAWLKRQEEKKKGIIEDHRPEGRKKKKEERERQEEKEEEERDLRVYVIARYDDYPDGQVPIAGQACNTGDTDPIYSRIHDSYNIDFSWDPPAMPAWESVRCFAKMMARVRISSDAERNDTEEIIEQVRKLDNPDSVPLCAPPRRDDDDDRDGGDDRDDRDDWDDEDDEERNPRWYIPTAEARESLDRIFTVWVTEVRPKLLPNLLDPALAGTDARPDILLAHIDFTLDDDWDDKDPKIEEHGFDPPDNSGRPFLLPTQVMQELLLLGHRQSERVEGGDGEALPEREFATIQVRNNHTLYAWVHHPRQLEIEADDGNWGEALEVRSNGQPLEIAHVVELEPNFFEIRVKVEGEGGEEGILMVPGARVELVFKVDEINVERADDDDSDEDEGKKSGDLGEDIEEGVEKVGEVAEQMVQGTGDVIEEAAGGIEEVVGEVIEDVGKGVKATGRALERALGAGEGVERAGARIEKAGEKVEGAGQELITTAQADEKRLDEEEKEDDEQAKEGGEEEDERELSLGRSIRKLGLDYVGYDRDEKTIIVYTIASHIPVRELVTFFTFNEQADLTSATSPHAQLRNAGSAESFLALWFHTDDPVRLPAQVRAQRVFVGQESQELLLASIPPRGRTFSRFWRLDPLSEKGVTPLIPGELLTVIFNTNEIDVGGEDAAESLTEVMKETPFTCIGYDGSHTIEVYHQVSIAGSQSEGEKPTITDKLAGSQRPAETNDPIAPTLPFVTILPMGSIRGAEGLTEAHLELWFHLSANPADNRIGFTDNLTFEALLEDGREMQVVRVEATRPTRGQHNVYTSTVTLPPPEREQRFYYLRLRFPLDANEVSMGGERIAYPTLREYIRVTGIRFEGYNGGDSILAYIRAVVPPPNTSRTA